MPICPDSTRARRRMYRCDSMVRSMTIGIEAANDHCSLDVVTFVGRLLSIDALSYASVIA